MAVERAYALLVLLPLLVLASDLYSFFLQPHFAAHPPHAAQPPHHGHHHHRPSQYPLISPPQHPGGGRPVDIASVGGRFDISFCSSCSYKKTALETRTALMNLFPETDVALANYPPPLHKRLLIKLVPIIQVAGIALVVGGDHIFPRLGYASPPSWYNSLRANRFGAAAGFWVLGNVLQNTLQSTGAFEVYFDGDLVFSKLKEGRFPEFSELTTRTHDLKKRW